MFNIIAELFLAVNPVFQHSLSTTSSWHNVVNLARQWYIQIAEEASQAGVQVDVRRYVAA